MLNIKICNTNVRILRLRSGTGAHLGEIFYTEAYTNTKTECNYGSQPPDTKTMPKIEVPDTPTTV